MEDIRNTRKARAESVGVLLLLKILIALNVATVDDIKEVIHTKKDTICCRWASHCISVSVLNLRSVKLFAVIVRRAIDAAAIPVSSEMRVWVKPVSCFV